MLPNGVLEDSHMNLVPDVEGKMLEAVEKRSEPRGLARTYASERANPLTSEDLVNANGKHIACLAPLDVGALPANCRRVDRSRVLHL